MGCRLAASWCLLVLVGACQQPQATLESVNPASESLTVSANIEAQRLTKALQQIPQLRQHIEHITTGQNQTLEPRAAGQALWREARDHLQQNWFAANESISPSLDDRTLYWARLVSMAKLTAQCTGKQCSADQKTFEWAARGGLNLAFEQVTDLNILVTGFDPFGLDANIDQSNPSGAAALALDNRILYHAAESGHGLTAEIQSVVFPVRFADFDEGQVESLLAPLLQNHQIDVLITVSMGRSQFDLERFPGKRRSATAPDNQNQTTGASAKAPLVPRLGTQELPGPEFVEFSLPTEALAAVQTPYPVIDNRKIYTLEHGTGSAQSLGQLAGLTAVSGSGGGYLSNEISYRSVRLSQSLKSPVSVGHIHTPRIKGFDPKQLQAITAQLENMLVRALPHWRKHKTDLSTELANSLRINQIQFVGSHNSYKKAMRPEHQQGLAERNPDAALALDYAHISLPDQLTAGIRKLELDLFASPTQDIFPVGHVQGIDMESHCANLSQCLEQVRHWSDANPNHMPIWISFNAKDQKISGLPDPEPFTPAAFDAFDKIVEAKLGDRLIRPSMIKQRQWPTLAQAHGKFLLILDEAGPKRQWYLESWAQRPLFTNVTEDHPAAAVMIINDPLTDGKRIQELVRQGYMVRTRADADTAEARTNNTQRRDAALASGAQAISTDYYQPSKRFSSPYVVRPRIRCNPINAPAICPGQPSAY